MKVLILNGSPRKNGNTSIAIDEMVKIFDAEGVETDVVQIGAMDIRGCLDCKFCKARLTLPFSVFSSERPISCFNVLKIFFIGTMR